MGQVEPPHYTASKDEPQRASDLCSCMCLFRTRRASAHKATRLDTCSNLTKIHRNPMSSSVMIFISNGSLWERCDSSIFFAASPKLPSPLKPPLNLPADTSDHLIIFHNIQMRILEVYCSQVHTAILIKEMKNKMYNITR